MRFRYKDRQVHLSGSPLPSRARASLQTWLTEADSSLCLSDGGQIEGVADIFVKEVAQLHGIPKSTLSDRDPLFMSHFWQEFFRLQGTRLHMSSSYHPESNRQTEVINRCVESYLHFLPWINHVRGRCGCHGQNFGITPPFMNPRGCHLLRLCTVANPRIYVNSFQVRCRSRL